MKRKSGDSSQMQNKDEERTSAFEYQALFHDVKKILDRHEVLARHIHPGFYKAAIENEKNLMGFVIGVRGLIEMIQNQENRLKDELGGS